MLQISQLKLPVTHTEGALREKAASVLRVDPEEIRRLVIRKRSIDARDKKDLRFVYTVQAEVSHEKKVLSGCRSRLVTRGEEKKYRFPKAGEREAEHPPLIIGSGPAGLFCAYMLAKHGYRPILLERGDSASVRRAAVDRFWESGELDTESNVQFGEGGAGTFSDGKLNTGVKDKYGRNHEVLDIFVRAGASEEILYDAKPHLGTDQLVQIVERMREMIISWGGQVHFREKVTDFDIRDGKIRGVRCAGGKEYPAEQVVLAIGHSARDTFEKLAQLPILMQAKPFAVGLRVEHPQAMINADQYGPAAPAFLGAAPYKLTKTLGNGRGVYSFCMCPGGYVVNASSEEGMTAVNGMSYQARDSANANSAIVVTVGPEDFATAGRNEGNPVLAGMHFQRKLERAAYATGSGEVPVQRFEDFCKNRTGGSGEIKPCIRGKYRFANVREILPEEIAFSLQEGITSFDSRIPGFASGEALLSGVESRTSSPVRIVRDDETLMSTVEGLYPCGEGAGYAGGITSAAMDGLKIAEKIASLYKPFR
uniref:NAD(P)/FAD-dependent oxidoreductase n=1 Tax=Eubacterium cellulosolvens TaxID=29322 RepID=UPI0004842E31|nr:FAD-dependent oxidoreductase [[Eubacterium] cellulosolvens]